MCKLLAIIPIVIVCLNTQLFAESELVGISSSLRNFYFQKAKVWEKREIRNTDVLKGPQSNIAVSPGDEVSCRYADDVGAGFAPKFTCQLIKRKETVMVKHSSREIFAEVAASRLLWALGFYADENYSVRLKCSGCPNEQGDQKSNEKILEYAMIERFFPGEIAEYPDQGWEWDDLDESQMTGATRAEIDALKLLAVFIQHTDSKREQQRLGCYARDIARRDDGPVCNKPVLMIQDLGATFGKGGDNVTSISSMTLAAWKNEKIWNEAKEREDKTEKGTPVCFGNLVHAKFMLREGLSHPEISEEGRRFLSDLLNQLSDQQIQDLFRAARADKTEEMIEEGGIKRAVTIADWVAAFKEKRSQINNRRCSSFR